MIRIISGKYRHRKINQPDSINVRPTMDRVKESIFSALGPIDQTEVLDLFAGSGAYGFESLSRGAKHITFVDSLKLSTKAIEQTISELKISSSEYKIILDDYVKALKNLKGQKFNLVFADPPYNMKNTASKLINSLLELELLKDNARVIIESQEETYIDERFTEKTYKYGKKFVVIYRRK